jgi:predicted TIM-barrel fold metal-dependent hydrolase
MATTGRIDTHHHIVPPAYRKWLSELSYFGGQATPAWSEESALRVMDEMRIETAIVSVARPGVHFGDDAAARRMARTVNEFAAEMGERHPGRFGFFAALPVPDVDGALEEAAYALDELGADGIVLLANTNGTYLGDPLFDPILAELDRRGSVLFVHPTAPPGPGIPGVPPFAADFLLDTTRAAINLVRHGAVRRFPNLRTILSHAGGFVPYAAYRMAPLTPAAGGHQTGPEEFLADLRTFYFDTALSSSPTCLPSLLAFADPERILFGSDWPYAGGDLSQQFSAQLDAYPLDGATRSQIDRGNAERLLPRFLATTRS